MANPVSSDVQGPQFIPTLGPQYNLSDVSVLKFCFMGHQPHETVNFANDITLYPWKCGIRNHDSWFSTARKVYLYHFIFGSLRPLCPECNKTEIAANGDTVATTPKLLERWDHQKNLPMKPEFVPSIWSKTVQYWWNCPRHNNSYLATLNKMHACCNAASSSFGCPDCKTPKVRRFDATRLEGDATPGALIPTQQMANPVSSDAPGPQPATRLRPIDHLGQVSRLKGNFRSPQIGNIDYSTVKFNDHFTPHLWNCGTSGHSDFLATAHDVYLCHRIVNSLTPLCPECYETTVPSNEGTVAHDERLIMRWDAEKNFPIPAEYVPFKMSKHNFWWQCQIHHTSYQASLAQMSGYFDATESSFGCQVCRNCMKSGVNVTHSAQMQAQSPLPPHLVAFDKLISGFLGLQYSEEHMRFKADPPRWFHQMGIPMNESVRLNEISTYVTEPLLWAIEFNQPILFDEERGPAIGIPQAFLSDVNVTPSAQMQAQSPLPQHLATFIELKPNFINVGDVEEYRSFVNNRVAWFHRKGLRWNDSVIRNISLIYTTEPLLWAIHFNQRIVYRGEGGLATGEPQVFLSDSHPSQSAGEPPPPKQQRVV